MSLEKCKYCSGKGHKVGTPCIHCDGKGHIITDLFDNVPQTFIKALTWKEPFASLMIHGKIETRVWNTEYRGNVLICAGLQSYDDVQIKHLCGTQAARVLEYMKKNTNDCKGHAIAVGRLNHVRRMEPTDEEACYVQYAPSLYCHIYTNVRPIIKIPYSGAQRFGLVMPEVLNKIVYL